jgi:hypothetical protein
MKIHVFPIRFGFCLHFKPSIALEIGSISPAEERISFMAMDARLS